MANDLFGGGLPVPIDAQIKEVEREIKQRERVYARWALDPHWIVLNRGVENAISALAATAAKEPQP